MPQEWHNLKERIPTRVIMRIRGIKIFCSPSESFIPMKLLFVSECAMGFNKTYSFFYSSHKSTHLSDSDRHAEPERLQSSVSGCLIRIDTAAESLLLFFFQSKKMLSWILRIFNHFEMLFSLLVWEQDGLQVQRGGNITFVFLSIFLSKLSQLEEVGVSSRNC